MVQIARNKGTRSKMMRVIIFLCAVHFIYCSTLPISRLVPDHTMFFYQSSPDSPQSSMTYKGLTIGGNLVLSDDSTSEKLIFEKPNVRTSSPDDDRFKSWYSLSLANISENIAYDPRSNQAYDRNTPLFTKIFGSPDVIYYQNATTSQSDSYFNAVLDRLILRGVNVTSILLELYEQGGTAYPMALVGGCVRDFLTNNIAAINDIDVAISQDYRQIQWRLQDIFVENNFPIDSTVLDFSGLRKEFGLLKVRKNSYPLLNNQTTSKSCKDARNSTKGGSPDALCYSDGLDIGPFKGIHFDKKELKKYISGTSLSDDEMKNHYLYGFSYDMDAKARDFTINCVYYQLFPRDKGIFIDPTGKGIADAANKSLRIAEDGIPCGSNCNWEKDLGGWFRFWRFIAPECVDGANITFCTVDGKGYTAVSISGEDVAENKVCENMINLVTNLKSNGKDPKTGYNIPGFFIKWIKKRDFSDMNKILDSMDGLMSRGPRCRQAWDLILDLSVSKETATWLNLLDGDSAENVLVGQLVDNLASRRNRKGRSATDSDSTPVKNSVLRNKALRNLQTNPIVAFQQKSIDAERESEFSCFIERFVLNGNSYANSELVMKPNVEESFSEIYDDIANPVQLEDQDYNFNDGFEEEELPTTLFRYPAWSDLVIYANEYSDRYIYVHKLILLLEFSETSTLANNSELSQYVQLLIEGDPAALNLNSITLTDISFNELKSQMEDLYNSLDNRFLQSLSNWRNAYLQGNSQAVLNQWNALSSLVQGTGGIVSAPRFVVASYCTPESLDSFFLDSYSTTLLWPIYHDNSQPATIPAVENLNEFLNVIFGLQNNVVSPETQQLYDRCRMGNSYCEFDGFSSEPEITSDARITTISFVLLLLVCLVM